MRLRIKQMSQTILFAGKISAVLLITQTALFANGLDFQKIEKKGLQYSKELKAFADSGLINSRKFEIEKQINNFETVRQKYIHSQGTEKSAALKDLGVIYEQFQGEFKLVAEILREWVKKYQNEFNRRYSEPYKTQRLKERILNAADVGKRDENLALTSFTDQKYAYAAHLFGRSLKNYQRAFELREWQQLAPRISPTAPKKKSVAPAPAKKIERQ